MTIPGNATIKDTFHRTVSPGWGTSDSGHVWTAVGSGGTLLGTDSTVTSPTAQHSVPATSAYRLTYLAAVSQTNVDMSATGSATFAGAVAGGNLEMLGVAFRAATLVSYYLARVEVLPGGSMTLRLIAPDAVTTVATATGIVGGLTYTSGKSLTIRILAVDTLIRIKVWDPAGAEPATWDISVGDTSTTAAGFVAIRAGVGAGNTNTKPIVFNFTEFWVAPTPTIGEPFLPALLGANARIAFESAFGADLTDIDGAGWLWTDLGSDPRHDPGVSATVGRSDNVSQAGAAATAATLNNQHGNYTPSNPTATNNVALNTPFRERMTLDGSTWTTRFQGYLDSANPVTDQSARVRGVDAAAFGALGRLGGLKKPLQSPMYRANQADPNLIAYWAMEDLAGSSALASSVPNGRPMRTINSTAIKFADAAPDGSLPLPNFSNNAIVIGDVQGAAPGSWAVSFALRPNDISTTDTVQSVSVYSGNFVFQFGYLNPLPPTFPTASVSIVVSGAGFNLGSPDAFDYTGGPDPLMAAGEWAHIQMCAVQVGADIHLGLYCNGIDMSAGVPFVLTGVTLGAINRVQVGGPISAGGSFQSNDVNVGHAGVSVPCPVTGANSNPTPANTAQLVAALDGYTGERADARLARLCAEAGFVLTLSGTSNVTMGPQAVNTILNLMRECEAADHGVLYDGLGPGVGYQCRSDRYNATSVLTLDMGADPPQVATFVPKFDKQALKNLYSVSRKNGGSAIAEQTVGPLRTALAGVEDAEATINVDSDDVLQGHAGWLVLLGTVPGFRFPATGLNMRGIPSLAAAVLGVGIGDRITIRRPAAKSVDLPPDDIDLIVEGWTETTSASTWMLALNCSPFAPNVIATVNDTAGRVDSTDSVVHLDATTTATTISVSGTLPWVTTAAFPGDFPFDITVTGERMTVTAITGATPPQTFTVTRSVNGVVKGHLAANNEAVRVQTPLVIGL